jgi:hypothetical protein
LAATVDSSEWAKSIVAFASVVSTFTQPEPTEPLLGGGVEAAGPFELAFDFRRRRRFRITRLIRLAVVSEPDELSESDELEELDESDELDGSMMLASQPGCDSSSMRACGVLR